MRKRVAWALAVSALVVVPSASGWSWPLAGQVVQPFAFDRAHPYAAGQRRGIDIAASPGTTVVAPVSGSVTFAGVVPSSGRSVSILSGDYSVTLTLLGSISVGKGATVAEGEVLGTVDDTGVVHLGVRVASDPQGYVDPLAFLPAPAVAETASGGSSASPAPEGAAPVESDAPAAAPSGTTGAPEADVSAPADSPADGAGADPAAGPAVDAAPAETPATPEANGVDATVPAPEATADESTAPSSETPDEAAATPAVPSPSVGGDAEAGDEPAPSGATDTPAPVDEAPTGDSAGDVVDAPEPAGGAVGPAPAESDAVSADPLVTIPGAPVADPEPATGPLDPVPLGTLPVPVDDGAANTDTPETSAPGDTVDASEPALAPSGSPETPIAGPEADPAPSTPASSPSAAGDGRTTSASETAQEDGYDIDPVTIGDPVASVSGPDPGPAAQSETDDTPALAAVAVELADEAPRTDLPALSEQQPTATPTIAASRRDDFTVAVAPEAQRSDSNATSSAGTREVEHPVGRTLRALSEHLVGRIRTRASSASAAASVTAPSLPEHRLLEVAPSAPHAAAPLVPIRGANGRGQGVISTEGLLAGLLIALASLLGLGLRRAMRLVGRACKMRSASAEPACPPREDASEFAACPAWPARRPLSRRIGSSAHRLRGHEHSRERKARARRGDTRRELRRAPAAR